jgi:hypothetical protein
MSAVLDKMAKTAHTWNGAISYATTGTGKYGAILDYWSKAGAYQGRPQEAVNSDMARIFADDESVALAVVFALRLITRTPNVAGIDEVQTGYGRKDEFFKALNWLCDHRPHLVTENLHLIPVFGCWKDFLQFPLIDRDDLREAVYDLVRANLGDDLLRKYLPTIYSTGKKRRRKSKSVVRCHTERAIKLRDWARGLCRHLGITFAEYRRLKREGAAHLWQQQMSAGAWDDINFNGIPGRAMLFHTSRKGKHDRKTVFERHGQVERLRRWVLEQPTVKFTGYPYELTRAASHRNNPSLVQKLVYNRQFLSLLEPMKGHRLGNVLCALDTSGSMQCRVVPNVSAYDICLSMGLCFSALNVGHFKDAVVAFSDVSRLVTLKGEFCDRLYQIESMTTAWGSTNFQSVIDLLVRIRQQHPEIPRDEYPETLLVISDMQFNPTGKNRQTNYETAMRKLHAVGLGDLRIIWWFVNGAGTDFPVQMNEKGMYLIGGFDPNNVKALMGLNSGKQDFVASERKEESPLDGMMNFLRQPIFGLLRM